jgi:hypothetical protein
MPDAQLTARVNGGWLASNDTGLIASQRFGVSNEPSRDIRLSYGTGSGQINVIYRKAFTLAPTISLDIDFKGGTGELDVLNVALSLAKIRCIDLVITTAPAADVAIRLGPQGQTNGFIGPWKDIDSYVSVKRRLFLDDIADGWVVDATHKILRINNPSAGSVSGVLEIFGTSA